MGRNLTNLYISQSFEYLVQLSGSELQTGLGSTLTGSLLITASKADTATSASFATTATSASFATTSTSASFASTATSASFASTATSASQATSASFAITASYAMNAGTTVSTASLLTTASATANVITFTKGDGSTFPVTIATGSAVSASFATTASLALNNVLTSSTNNDTITFTKGDGTTYTNVINNVSASISASRATSAASADTATTASYVLNAVSASYALSASQAQNAVSASYALSASQAANATTASFALNITGGLSPNFNNVTASNVLITGTASVALLHTTTISSSVIFSSGSNTLGDNATLDTQTLIGIVKTSGSFSATGSAGFTGGDFKVTDQNHNGEFDVDLFKVQTQTGTQFTGSVSSQNGFTGSLAGTASYANNALSSSYAVSASQAQNAVSSSYAVTASFALNANVNTGSLLTTASAAGNVVTFTKGDGSTFPVTVATGSASAFPFTGSAQITGSLGVTGSFGVTGSAEITNNLFVSNNLGSVNLTQSNVLLVGTNNILGNDASDSIFVGQSLNLGNYLDNSAVVGGIGHRLNYGYGYIFGGLYNYIGYNSPGPQGDVYGAVIAGGSENTLNGKQANNMAIWGGANNEIYATSSVDYSFAANSAILGGRFNKISGSQVHNSAILSSYGSLINDYSSSVIIGGRNITASAHNTVFVPNLTFTGSLVREGSSTSTYPALLLGSGSGRPLIFYNGGGINPTFDAIESNTSINNFIAGGTQCFTYMGLNNQFVFGYNYPNPTFESNANNFSKFYYGLHVTGGLQVSGSVVGNVIGNDTDTYTGSAPVQQIVTLTQAEYNAIGSPNANTLYIISGSNPTSYATTGSNTFYGTQTFSGSVRGVVISSSISSNTASLDFSTANFFSLNTANVLNTHIVPTNIVPGQTVNLELSYPATGSSITFPSFVKQPSGSAYIPSGAGTTDILTFIAFTTSSVYLSSVKNMI